MIEGAYPVHWTGRQALLVLPEHIDLSNSGEIRGDLLAVINRGAAALIADMTRTVSCDHSGIDALARAHQRAVISGTDVRLVVTSPVVRRVLGIGGIDQLMSLYPSREAALAARAPAAARDLVPPTGARARAGSAPAAPGSPDSCTETALLDRHGVIVSVNDAWLAFAAANQGDPARTGRGVSYLEVCAAAADEPVALEVAATIRRALAGDLPGPVAVKVPCHSPDTARWFDMLISTRLDGDGRHLGATVTLSLAGSHPGATPVASRRGAGATPDSGEAPRRPREDRDRTGAGLNDVVARRLFAAALSLHTALGLLGDHPAAGKLHHAITELDLAVTDLRDSVRHRNAPAARSQG